jgi:hypothetical protein
LHDWLLSLPAFQARKCTTPDIVEAIRALVISPVGDEVANGVAEYRKSFSHGSA